MPPKGHRFISRLITRTLTCAVIVSLLTSCQGIKPTPAPSPSPPAPGPVEGANSPTYNVTIDESSRAPLSRHVLVPDLQPNTARLSIGLPDPNSVLQDVVPDLFLRRYTGRLQVIFHCLVCADQRPLHRTIDLDAGFSISELEFPFLPTYEGTRARDGVGSIVFTIYDNERAVDRIAIPVLISPVNAATLATAERSLLPPLVTTLSETIMNPLIACAGEGCFPFREQLLDVRLQISENNRRIAIEARLVSPRLVRHMQRLGWTVLAGESLQLETTLSATTLEQRLKHTYRRLQAAIRSPSDETLRTALQALTSDTLTLQNPLRLSVEQRDALSLVLASAGEGLYADLRRTPPMNTDLRRFFDNLIEFAVSHADSSRPLRISVTNATPTYIPWQLLYVLPLDPIEPVAESGGFLGYLAEVSEDRLTLGAIHATDQNRAFGFDGSNTVYAMYSRGSAQEDEISVRASNLLTHLKSAVLFPDEIAYAAARAPLLRTLQARSQNMRLLAIYAHGSSEAPIGGPVLRLNDREYITPDHLRQLARSTQTSFFGANPVVLMVACELGTGGDRLLDDNDFPATFLSLGSSSVIAPVSEVWGAYAAWFARDFITLFAGGSDVPQSVRGTVRKHMTEYNNPAGLLFSVFGDPTL